MTLRIDPVAGAVALLTNLIPSVTVHGDATPDTRPAIVVRESTGPADIDLPLIRSRLDVRVHPELDPAGESPEDQARRISAMVFGALHRTYVADVWVPGYESGLDLYRKFRSFSVIGEQLIADPDTNEPYVFDTYEVTWYERPVRHRETADATTSITA